MDGIDINLQKVITVMKTFNKFLQTLSTGCGLTLLFTQVKIHLQLDHDLEPLSLDDSLRCSTWGFRLVMEKSRRHL